MRKFLLINSKFFTEAIDKWYFMSIILMGYKTKCKVNSNYSSNILSEISIAQRHNIDARY